MSDEASAGGVVSLRQAHQTLPMTKPMTTRKAEMLSMVEFSGSAFHSADASCLNLGTAVSSLKKTTRETACQCRLIVN